MGPYEVISIRSPLTTEIQIKNRKQKVSNNRLKPFFDYSYSDNQSRALIPE